MDIMPFRRRKSREIGSRDRSLSTSVKVQFFSHEKFFIYITICLYLFYLSRGLRRLIESTDMLLLKGNCGITRSLIVLCVERDGRTVSVADIWKNGMENVGVIESVVLVKHVRCISWLLYGGICVS